MQDYYSRKKRCSICVQQQLTKQRFYMGRTLDYEFSYGEQITITPRNYEFDFRFAGKIKSHYALIGMAFVAGGYPLYYDAVNEKGLGMAGLNLSAMRHMKRLCRKMKQKSARWHSSSSSHGSLHSVLL